MKRAKRILISIAVGMVIAAIVGTIDGVCLNSTKWMHNAIVVGWTYGTGTWIAIGMKNHKSED